MGWRKGDTILTAEPYAHVLSAHCRGIRCDSCLLSYENLKKCTGCGLLKYCNTKCQRKDWPIHKKECACLRNVAPDIPTESVRLLLRLILRKQQGSEAGLPLDSVKWRTFGDLQSHSEEIKQDGQRSKILAEMTLTLKKLTEGQVDFPSGEELLEIYGKMVINTFSICDGEMQAIGSGLYISPSLLDHSCVPNAVTVFTGTSLSVRCVADIKGDNPREVYVSYIDQLAPSSDRNRQLKEQYYFTCTCPRCQDKILDQKMLAIRCNKKNCDSVVYPTETGDCHDGYEACASCETKTEDRNYTARCRKVMGESLDAVLKLDDLKKHGGDPEVRLQFCKDLLEKQQVLSACNVHHVKTLDRAMDACIDSGFWEAALQYGEMTVQPYIQLHPPLTPIVGIQLMKMGKLQLYLKKLAAASASLQQAECILSVTHGRSHSVYRDLVELLDQCAEERRMTLEHSEDS